jgi:signal peptide peptidase SppA
MTEDAAAAPLDLPHIAARLFGAPLMLHPAKLEAILFGLAPRFGGLAPRPLAFDQQDEMEQRRERRRAYAVTPDGIAVVPVIGGLVARAGRMAPDSTELRSYARVDADLRQALADAPVRAIVLDIDSPGGEAQGAMEFAARLRALRGRKPIVAAVNHGAYSAAYAIASAADRIIIPPSGGVGSIGVVAAHLDVSAAEARQGIAWTFVHAGARKLDGSPHAPLSDAARARMQSLVDALYGQFTRLVAAGRAMPEERVRATEAGIFFGAEAVEAGLADAIGAFDDALEEAGRMAGLAGAGNTGRGRPSAHTRPAGVPMDETTQAGTASASTEGAPPAPDIAAIREDARRAEAARARGIAALCQLAGVPAQAAEHIAEGRTEAQVRDLLLAARAARGAEGGEIVATRPADAGVLGAQAGRAGAGMAPAAIDAAWNRIGAEMFGASWKGI